MLATYVRTQRLLRRDGLPAAIEWTRNVRPVAPAPQHEITPAAYGVGLGKFVARALLPLPSDTRCLARSLVLTGMLARRGIPTSLVIGVAPNEKFEAHAWVEFGDRALLPTGRGTYERLIEL